jgi:hypothetical protein
MSRTIAHVRFGEYSALLSRPRFGSAVRAAQVGRIVGRAIIGVELVWIAYAMAASLSSPSFGFDFHLNVEAGRRLLETGTPYLPFQLAGPFVIGDGAILYPPTAFFLLVPFLWLPAVLWWAIPIAGLAYGLWWHRPPVWAWVVIVSLLALPKTLNVYVFGNPSMWIAAAVAAGTVWRWPFVFAFFKPTFIPIALLGVRGRRWWVGVVVIGAASLVFLPVWFDWFTVVRNSDVSPLYNLPTVPLMLTPLVAWATGRARPDWLARLSHATD